jgi:hypothetical protein
MKMISERTYKFFREQYERVVHDWFDDPDDQFTGWTHADLLDWWETLQVAAKDLDLDFWKMVRDEEAADCTEYEINRVKAMLKKAGHPEYINYEPDPDQ